MAEVTRVDPEDKSSLFEISTHTYKTNDETPILTDVLVPKRIVQDDIESPAENEKLPIMIHLHEGVLVKEFLPWFSIWLLELTLKHNAIILGHNLDSAKNKLRVATTICMDLNRVLVTAESAGGYLAMQLALEHFNSASEPKIRTVVPLYPIIGQMIDVRSPYWIMDYEKSIFGGPQLPSSFIDEFIVSASKSPKQIVTNNPIVLDSPRIRFSFALVQRGRILEVMGPDHNHSPGKLRIHPEDRIVDGWMSPPTLFLQGSEDGVVPLAGFEKIVDFPRRHKAVMGLKEGRDDDEVLRLVVHRGERGFDNVLHIDDEDCL
ncbi:hypothetical protein ACEPAH_2669 [Sanghuangporus vaninii]